MLAPILEETNETQGWRGDGNRPPLSFILHGVPTQYFQVCNEVKAGHNLRFTAETGIADRVCTAKQVLLPAIQVSTWGMARFQHLKSSTKKNFSCVLR